MLATVYSEITSQSRCNYDSNYDIIGILQTAAFNEEMIPILCWIRQYINRAQYATFNKPAMAVVSLLWTSGLLRTNFGLTSLVKAVLIFQKAAQLATKHQQAQEEPKKKTNSLGANVQQRAR